MKNKAKVSIVMGSDSDLEVMSEGAKLLEEFGISYEMQVVSAHRSPNLAHSYAVNAKKNGIEVIIAGAGGSAHLAGVIASLTTLPVVGIPIKAKTLDGMDSLLSTVSMPPGVPVATVGINSAKNAGILAIQILALNDKRLSVKFSEYKKKMEEDTKKKGARLLTLGYKKYLNEKK